VNTKENEKSKSKRHGRRPAVIFAALALIIMVAAISVVQFAPEGTGSSAALGDTIVGDGNPGLSAGLTAEQDYTITATSDAGSRISPSGNVTVHSGGTATFYFTVIDANIISTVTVDGHNLSQSEIDLGSITFTDVSSDHIISVHSYGGHGTDTMLTISVVEGKGHAEYEVGDGDFLTYVAPAFVPVDEDITVRAVADNGYEFSGWGDANGISRNADYTYNATSPLNLDLHFSGRSPSIIGHDELMHMAAVGGLLALFLIGAGVWYYYFHGTYLRDPRSNKFHRTRGSR